MTLTRRLARPMLASTFVYGGVQALKNADALAPKAKAVNDQVRSFARRAVPQVSVPESDATLVRINAATQLVAGLGLATNRLPRVSGLLLAASVVPTTVAGHPFWQEKDKDARAKAMTQFFKNLSMLGGLTLAAVDTNGKPGLPWRTKNAVSTARREAKHLSRRATLTARSAKP